MAPYATLVLALLSLTPFASGNPQLIRHVYPRQASSGNGTNPTPQIFYNLTIGEWQEELRNYYGLPILLDTGNPTDTGPDDSNDDNDDGGIGNGTVVDFRRKRSFGPIVKRDIYGGEVHNDPVTQGVINRRNADCRESFGQLYRVRYGNCDSRRPLRMNIFCGAENVPNSRRTTTRYCEQDETCATIRAHNYLNNTVDVPYCGKTIETVPDGHHIDPLYEGYKGLPTETWSPGTYNEFFTIVDTIPNLTAAFDYRGHWNNGQGFESGPVRAHSWSCINCPSGRLYVDTVGIRLKAVGFAYASDT